MAGLEFEGKTVKDAIENACSKLNISQRELKYDIISNGSTGIFGFVGVKKAKIRVYYHKKPESSSKRNEHQGTSDSFSSGIDPREVISLVDEAFSDLREETLLQKDTREEKKQKSQPKKQTHFTSADQDKDESIDSKALPAPTEKEVKSVDIKDDTSLESESFEEEKPSASETFLTDEMVDNCADLGLTALKKILEYLTDDVQITLEKTHDKLLFRIEGGNSSMLIGKRGQNLEAIQYIIDKIVNKNITKHIRVQVDVAGYTEKRKENLIKMAERLAQKTKRTGKPSTVGPMNAQDRRIIHITLKNFRGVRTQSIGEGYYRKLMIFPKQANRKKTPSDVTESENTSI